MQLSQEILSIVSRVGIVGVSVNEGAGAWEWLDADGDVAITTSAPTDEASVVSWAKRAVDIIENHSEGTVYAAKMAARRAKE